VVTSQLRRSEDDRIRPNQRDFRNEEERERATSLEKKAEVKPTDR